ncbi:MAG: class I SAM-dependent methyltransferase [Candidatus Aminicenantes bacterium]|nr:class I SAM-dependent methyltransferase [Candidatus Aminicenantes bacterium]
MKLPPKPDHIHNLEFIRILSPYVFVCGSVKEKSVLDVGCGSGHGTWLFVMKGAHSVLTLDLDKAKVSQAHRFCKEFKEFLPLTMDAQRMGFKEHSFQVVTCFELIEHIPNPDLLFSELRRIVKSDGVLFLTTPNRVMRLLPLQRPWNPEHLCEYTVRSLRRHLRNHFPFFEIFGIYGEPKINEYYRKIWKKNPLQVYFGWTARIMDRLTSVSGKRWLRDKLSDHKNLSNQNLELTNMATPTPDPKSWPFYVNDVREDCLNFLTICGLNDLVIKEAAAKIKRSRWKLQ